ncbi:hypothetical protein ACFYM0_33920 [Streptomyces sp. NPDC006487]|uniref:hypothetical protein n=1 Tax=Streptomyces sp. NPDC006487 TaxID=3364748 RepID=UPI0036B9E872
MGAIPTSPTALLGAAAAGALLVFGAAAAALAPAASAVEVTPKVVITPSTVAPGGQVTLTVSGCDTAFATVSSGIFDTVSINRGTTARVAVDRDARPGAQYSVTVTCSAVNGSASVNGSADLTITGGTGRPTTSSTVGTRKTPTASAPTGTRTGTSAGTGTGASRSAVLGVRGGLGGSVAGLDPLELGAGAGLVLGGLVGLGYALRRRDIRRIH